MSDIPAPPIAGDVLATLRSHEGSLRDAGILHLALFGSACDRAIRTVFMDGRKAVDRERVDPCGVPPALPGRQ
ncbi:MAG: hypothetical protein U1E70_14695 [Acetobacteraceae bacterium]